jgi:hypothetical protein
MIAPVSNRHKVAAPRAVDPAARRQQTDHLRANYRRGRNNRHKRPVV